jgi:hypothetical protein
MVTAHDIMKTRDHFLEQLEQLYESSRKKEKMTDAEREEIEQWIHSMAAKQGVKIEIVRE